MHTYTYIYIYIYVLRAPPSPRAARGPPARGRRRRRPGAQSTGRKGTGSRKETLQVVVKIIPGLCLLERSNRKETGSSNMRNFSRLAETAPEAAASAGLGPVRRSWS